MSDKITIRSYVPGAIGRIVELHARYYSEAWKFGPYFEAKVAKEMGEFIGRFDAERDIFRTLFKDDTVSGAIAIDGTKAFSDGAHLRWFIVAAELRGHGWGNRLLDEAVSFCKQKNYPTVYLWTFKGLDAARHLYEKFGFKLADEREGVAWGTKVLEQKFAMKL